MYETRVDRSPRQDLEFTKQNIASGERPWKQAWENVADNAGGAFLARQER
jgi:hypothetical protein